MAKNWAVCIGINNYVNMPNLKCAKPDAKEMQNWFLNEAGFEKVYLFTDDSPEITDSGTPFSSQPTYGTLKRFLRVRFNKSFLSTGDNLWFFFSGHGLRHTDRDYLMPSDADPHPEGVEDTAIPLNDITERLRRCGADNVILLLDACRNEGSSKGLGVGEEKLQGVITIASCSPSERSYEIEQIQQGSFTHALLESLRIQGEGNCATVERLYQRLCHRVTEINHHYQKPRQTPYVIAEPATKYHLILLPRQATLHDITQLKVDAQEAEIEGDSERAEQLWTRILAISPADPQALKALKRIWSSTPTKQLLPPFIDPSKGEKKVTPSLSKAYWLFQGNPKYYRMFDAIRDLQEMPWPLNRYKTEIKVGDEAVIWVSGKESGIYAFGEIIEPVKILEEVSDIDYWIDTSLLSNLRTQPGPRIRLTSKLLEKPLLREELKQDPILKNLSVIRVNRGSVFRVTPEQWRQIHELKKNTSTEQFVVELKSEKGVDYTKLRDLLAAGKWKEADQETADVMLQVANRVSEGWLRVEDIDNFPCEDLRTIDQLWVHYSKGKFGFSVQKKIYRSQMGSMDELGGTRDYNKKIWYEFCDRVGWRKEGSYVRRDDLTFELLDTTPGGHLPFGYERRHHTSWSRPRTRLFSGISNCKL